MLFHFDLPKHVGSKQSWKPQWPTRIENQLTQCDQQKLMSMIISQVQPFCHHLGIHLWFGDRCRPGIVLNTRFLACFSTTAPSRIALLLLHDEQAKLQTPRPYEPLNTKGLRSNSSFHPSASSEALNSPVESWNQYADAQWEDGQF